MHRKIRIFRFSVCNLYISLFGPTFPFRLTVVALSSKLWCRTFQFNSIQFWQPFDWNLWNNSEAKRNCHKKNIILIWVQFDSRIESMNWMRRWKCVCCSCMKKVNSLLIQKGLILPKPDMLCIGKCAKHWLSNVVNAQMQSNNCNRLFRLCKGGLCASNWNLSPCSMFQLAIYVCIKYQYSVDLSSFYGYAFRLTNHKHTEKLSR